MVPGAIGAWAQLVKDHGTRSLGEILQPAIKLAEEGYIVQSRVAWDWARNAPVAAKDPDTAKSFLSTAGARRRRAHAQPQLAATLRLVAEKGAGFYQGAVAEDIVTKLRSIGGLHTMEDLPARSRITSRRCRRTIAATRCSNVRRTGRALPP